MQPRTHHRSIEKHPLRVFFVSVYGHRIRVRIYQNINSVHRAYISTPSACSSARAVRKNLRGKHVHGFCMITATGKVIITTATASDLFEIIPHEVTHAADFLIPHAEDELKATVVGLFCKKIFAALKKHHSL